MNKKWKADNVDWKELTCEDTSLREKFPYVNELLSKLPTNKIERIRFMSLAPGGGELQRHTDQVDPDLGVNDGRIMRLHIPVITNPKMEFTSWDMHGKKHVKNMKETPEVQTSPPAGTTKCLNSNYSIPFSRLLRSRRELGNKNATVL